MRACKIGTLNLKANWVTSTATLDANKAFPGPRRTNAKVRPNLQWANVVQNLANVTPTSMGKKPVQKNVEKKAANRFVVSQNKNVN